MDGELFITSVEEAVSLSLSAHKSLVVYNGREQDDKEWLEEWADTESLRSLRNKAIWLKLRPNSQQFQYFEQMFPSVAVPSMCVITQGKIVAIILGPQANIKQLADALKVSVDGDTIKGSDKSFKDQVMETTQRKRLEEVKRQKQMAKEERERILQLVRADRAERKAMELSDSVGNEGSDNRVHDNIKDLNKLHSKTCDLMIRLTDSSTLTGHFEAKDTLKDVRKWVDEHRTDGDCLYAFHRNIPRVTFTDSEELERLEELQLLPRSVLILKPLENSDTSVAAAKGPGLLGKVFTGFSSWLSRGNTSDNDSGKSHSNSGGHGSRISRLNTRDSRRSDNVEERDTINHNNGIESSPRVSLSNSEELTMDSPVSSRFESPSSHVADHHHPSISSPSDLNLPSRCVTPNVRQFVNKDDDEKEKSTYNGNTINLEKKDDD